MRLRVRGVEWLGREEMTWGRGRSGGGIGAGGRLGGAPLSATLFFRKVDGAGGGDDSRWTGLWGGRPRWA